MDHRELPRPFLKWAGGKGRITHRLVAAKPRCFFTYHEPFLGSGALFFHLYREKLIRHAVLSDINAELIDTYQAIRDHFNEVIRLLRDYPYSKEFYYEIRQKDPQTLTLPERAARMIYLNKTGYNGLYRVNSAGKFNVPFGRHRRPRYFDPENLRAVSQALQEVTLLCTSFETVLDRSQPGDWIYFDPPYVPLSRTANFTEYSAHGFGQAQQQMLRSICIELTKRGIYITLSNSDTSYVRNLYSMPEFTIDSVFVGRAINCQGTKRRKVSELIITNYPKSYEISPLFFQTRKT
ncbi:MAG: DNA adenine methylase [Gemmatales bacterium]|nr:DNA adenine methylase [Gemmatales bacterium]MCS7161570.1 DNA adenine methylase [Gemmatales bacterium]MDW8176773.1 DNA adenine methylase [Gemmatales bacterium]MDW8221480.1 DNA adenine methylase [Gemmatales bacterium]